MWDGKIYLVAYDIPRESNKDRNLFRRFLKRIGCGMLQHSVWVTAYTPNKLINEFIYERGLDDELIIVSSVGKDGTVGDTTLQELMEKVYGLSNLNERYLLFIEKVEKGELSTMREVVFSYLSILKDDPQIPFELLPRNWLGDTACKIYEETKTTSS
jgi:phenylacetic acid degradation operon negative regulatory protein